ncbi:MAG: aspartate--tRNA ligase [Bacteroidales bacterium]|nr:aspartate--tRNA ligase [Bacteroidales bacterium]MDD4576177.1 aspartate--tRNA ligase [Bacteroidales bacterium]
MLRTHTCGVLNLSHLHEKVKLSGWIQRSRDLGGMTFIDLRDRYGITQLVFNMEVNAELCEKARKMGREWVIQIEGMVTERSSKNKNIPSGDIEIVVDVINVLNKAKTPPFTIEDHTDGGEELRMKYRYLDLRRNPVKNNLIFRHKLSIEIRNYLNDIDFLEIETPFLIKSTPEGARDFIVPSRMNPGQFYALPQSPQTFKQLLMVSGMDRYFQIVRCFRDEDLRADRQPEFTQIDCEMAFVDQKEILDTFEGLIKHLFKKVKNIEFDSIPQMTYADAMRLYGNDKPDLRFGMTFVDVTNIVKGKDFKIFDDAEAILGINAKNCASYTRKQIDALTDFVKRPQVGASGMVYIRYNEDGTLKSSVDKFYTEEDLKNIAMAMEANPGDLMLLLSGKLEKTQKALSELRLEMGNQLELRNPSEFAPLWVIDFPLLEWDEETHRFYAKHHPFTAPKPEDVELMSSNPAAVRANAYDLVINGSEIGGGSIRIFEKEMQNQNFKLLGFSAEEAQAQFGFLLNAFEYGAPPHAGIAFGFDRLCAVMSGVESIRDFIAFPKNNNGRDVMIDAPSEVADNQLDELFIKLNEIPQ